ncbi:hypothetical protein KC351_g7 [Hortaea werneckii]|nr:hypothetical protein KC351_g7 [Hortaea werneckii]
MTIHRFDDASGPDHELAGADTSPRIAVRMVELTQAGPPPKRLQRPRDCQGVHELHTLRDTNRRGCCWRSLESTFPPMLARGTLVELYCAPIRLDTYCLRCGGRQASAVATAGTAIPKRPSRNLVIKSTTSMVLSKAIPSGRTPFLLPRLPPSSLNACQIASKAQFGANSQVSAKFLRQRLNEWENSGKVGHWNRIDLPNQSRGWVLYGQFFCLLSRFGFHTQKLEHAPWSNIASVNLTTNFLCPYHLVLVLIQCNSATVAGACRCERVVSTAPMFDWQRSVQPLIQTRWRIVCHRH